ncbi:efflux RND transporter periplasmic adaptor subunit [Chryseolinea lacunae]|uniref:Efflux RND transporter periplasmic adaptor subunit n=1 Tax=Chryseolinea lacunae TaxID=2801331 RepID=A0ABS1KN07_9BACT|nr:efflux RND transporter periplasmic adaptor subunit [Chryseolinea lacunae]MBL0740062.1 efflux RND transporter periplasmic adaptor subunit [Chryseolinea lacunae]
MNTTKRNLLLAGVVLLTGAVLQSCTDSKGERKAIPNAADPVPVKIITLEKSSATIDITASGQLTTDDETVLSFKSGGVVSAVLVKEGEAVRKGQLLATLDLTELNAQVAQARFGYEKAQRDLQRVTNLYRDSVATLEQLQNVQTGLDISKQQLDAVIFNRTFAEIHAPANGYVLKKFVNSGQVVSTGNPVLTTNGAAQGNWILKVGVGDKQWAAAKKGDAATIAIDAFPGKTFKGTVLRKSETSDAQTGAFTLELTVDSDHEKLAAGMFGSTQIHSGQAASSWSVPYEAVLDANGGEGFVFVTADGKTAHKQPVNILSFDGKTIRISAGLEDATSLIIAGSAYLSDNSPIQILK